MRVLFRLSCLVVIALVGAVEARADPIQCSAFVHERDGSWRSFNEADVLGPDGPVHVAVGERLWPSAKSAKGNIARALDDLCSN